VCYLLPLQRLTLSQGLQELKNAMFTSSQMTKIENAAAALSSSGGGAMTRAELQQLYDQVWHS
jgi:hypothetical protein